MKFWPFRREARGFTEQRIEKAVSEVAGVSPSRKLAAVEAAAGVWERAFASAICPALPAHVLAVMGRSLLVTGEFAAHRNGNRWDVASDWDIRGDADRWDYRLSIPAPSTTITRRVSGASVLHVRIGSEPTRPWEGCSPLANSAATRDVLAAVERSLREEHSCPVGTVIAVSDPQGNAEVAATIGDLRGRVVLTEQSEGDLIGEGPGARNSWMPQRLGPNPDTETVSTRAAVERSIYAAAGIPPELMAGSTSETATREAYRRLVHATISPVGRLVSDELRRLGMDGTLDFEELRAADLQARTRGVGQLVTAGIAPERALEICGLGR